MTLGIGVLCSSMPRPHVPYPDAIVLLGDTIGSTETESIEAEHEVNFNPNEKLYGICIGRIERFGTLLESIRSELKQLKDRNVRGITEALNKAVHSHRVQHFKSDLLPPGATPESLNPGLADIWQQYNVGIHLLLGTFSEDGKALLYLIAQMGNLDQMVHRVDGDATIGDGGSSASFWLSFRQQAPWLSIRQSAYHSYEAARLTARPPTVDGSLEMIIATNDRAFHLTRKAHEDKKSPVSFLELEALLEKYGPRDTDRDLGHSNSMSAVAGKAK